MSNHVHSFQVKLHLFVFFGGILIPKIRIMNNDLILLILTICYTLIIYSDIARKKKLIIVKKKLKKMCVFIDICKRKRLYRTKIQSIYLYIYIKKKYK